MKTLSRFKSISMVGLIGLAGLAGCVDPSLTCSVGTHIEGNLCVADPVDITSDNQIAIDSAIQDKINSGELTNVIPEAENITEEQAKEEIAKVYTELYSEDFLFNDVIDLTLGDSKVAKLIDDEIKVNKQTYDVAEYIVINNDLDLITSADGDKDYDDKPYLNIGKQSISYEYRFEDALPSTEVDDEDSAVIKFAGKDLEIINIADGEITIKEAKTSTIKAGQSVGDAKLVRVGMNSAIVEVNGVTDIINLGDTRSINGIDVELVSVVYDVLSEGGYAKISVGEDITRTIQSGDSINSEIDAEDSEFVYDITTTDNGDGTYSLNKVSAVYNQRRRDIDEDSDYRALEVGGEINVLDYLKIRFKGTNNPSYLTMDIENEENNMVELRGDNEESFQLGTEEYKTVYLDTVNSLYCKDFECGTVLGDINTKLELDNSELTINTAGEIRDSADAVLLSIFNLAVMRDDPIMTSYGIQYYDSEDWNNGVGEELTVKIPEEQLEGTIQILG